MVKKEQRGSSTDNKNCDDMNPLVKNQNIVTGKYLLRVQLSKHQMPYTGCLWTGYGKLYP